MYHVTILLAAISVVTSRNVHNRIIGGEETSIEKHPYQVALMSHTNKHICGGGILNDLHVITAGHCAYGKDPLDVFVRADTSHRSSGGYYYNTVNNFIHSNFTIETLDYDVAIFKLKQPITFSASASPISLVPANERRQPGEMVTVTGWGRRGFLGEVPNMLQVVRIPVRPKELCQSAYSKGVLRWTARMFCAGGEFEKGSYRGDSGSPLVNERMQLVGLVSWGSEGNIIGYPAMFTDVTNSEVREFIDMYTDK